MAYTMVQAWSVMLRKRAVKVIFDPRRELLESAVALEYDLYFNDEEVCHLEPLEAKLVCTAINARADQIQAYHAKGQQYPEELPDKWYVHEVANLLVRRPDLRWSTYHS